MKIISLNINSIRARIESFIQLLNRAEFDVICVQELKVTDSDFPHNLFDTSGYNIKVYGQKSYNGVAIFSKHSIEDVIRGMPGYADPNARFLECVIDGRIRLMNVYMPNGEAENSPKFPYKIEWMHKFTKYIEPHLHSEEAVIIAGDFNVAIQDEDVWNPKNYEGSSISAPAARKIMQSWLDAGWRDEWRFINGEMQGYTWYGYRGVGSQVEKGHGLRLDYFLTNRAATKLVKNCYIDMEPRLADKPTDHVGLVLEIE